MRGKETNTECKVICKATGEGNQRTEVAPGKQDRTEEFVCLIVFFALVGEHQHDSMLRGNCQGRGRAE